MLAADCNPAILGGIMQKFVNYRLRWVVVGDITGRTAGARLVRWPQSEPVGDLRVGDRRGVRVSDAIDGRGRRTPHPGTGRVGRRRAAWA
ncbi:DUF4180 domain-containing protein [Micromonospora sp. Llam0]|uniref:DUF4180 domain-containing protein n=1 Tax=Micromonospora sp. Llam0 TaxID=2485143 RepID=UPI001F331CBA|nr:DUF4180 domain-containing protein [Micromonospora sp. Llam0]